MRLDLDTVIMDQFSKPILDNGKHFTLRSVLIGALLVGPDAGNLDGEPKFARYKLAQQLDVAGKYFDASVEQLAMFKRIVGIAYSVIVVGRVYDILDPPTRNVPLEVVDGSRPD